MITNQRDALNFILCYNSLFTNILHNINPKIKISYLKLNLVDYKHYNGFVFYNPLTYNSATKSLKNEIRLEIHKFYGMLFTYDFFIFYGNDIEKITINFIQIDCYFGGYKTKTYNHDTYEDINILNSASFGMSHLVSSIFWINTK